MVNNDMSWFEPYSESTNTVFDDSKNDDAEVETLDFYNEAHISSGEILSIFRDKRTRAPQAIERPLSKTTKALQERTRKIWSKYASSVIFCRL
jgi:hypothetical protein